jgi:hypothetical protein
MINTRTLPVNATDEEIKSLVVEWSELLAEKRYQEALAMFPFCNEEMEWTPNLLEKVINGYGVPADSDPETTRMLLDDWQVSCFEITTLVGRPDKEEIIRDSIEVDREHLFGLTPGKYLGMVHYNDVPLCGFRSDLTARFHIKKVGADRLTLEFLDIHVM